MMYSVMGQQGFTDGAISDRKHAKNNANRSVKMKKTKSDLDYDAAMTKLGKVHKTLYNKYKAEGAPEFTKVTQVPATNADGILIGYEYAQHLLEFEAATGQLPGHGDNAMGSATIVGQLSKLKPGEAIEFVKE